jgi:hypothetical protein
MAFNEPATQASGDGEEDAMRQPTRAAMRAAVLLAAVAALAGCVHFAQPEQLPSPYAGTWQDRAGRELPDSKPSGERFVLSSFGGSRHCAAESVVFLAIAWPPGKATSSIDAGTVRDYVRDPHGAYRQVPFRGQFAQDVPLPPDARATGYHHEPLRPVGQPQPGRPLRLRPRPRRVERWPRPVDRIYCA